MIFLNFALYSIEIFVVTQGIILEKLTDKRRFYNINSKARPTFIISRALFNHIKVLTVNQLLENYLLGRVADVVHHLHPKHLIVLLELFRHALCFHHLFCQAFQHLVRFVLGLLECSHQCASGYQKHIHSRLVLLQELHPHHTVPAKSNVLILRQFDVRDFVISDLSVFYVHIKPSFHFTNTS